MQTWKSAARYGGSGHPGQDFPYPLLALVCCAAFVFVAGSAGCSCIAGFECEVWSACCGLDEVDCVCVADAFAWCLDLALVVVALEDVGAEWFPAFVLVEF